MGVVIEGKKSKLPFLLKGKLMGGRYTVDGSQSSQYISGLLMALPLLDEDSELTVTNLLSKPYVEMTLHTLESFGIRMEHLDYKRFIIKGKQNYRCNQYVVENDWSSASYWLVAAAIGHNINLSGLNLESKQADTQILQALKLSRCHVRIKDGLLSIEGSGRIAFDFDATHCPDLFPALVTLAAFCNGTSTLKGALRLKNKESDRGRVLQNEYQKIGLRIDLKDDEMKIHGGKELYSAEVDSNKDHRIAMCLAITGTKIKGGLVIKNAESVTKSYKNFWEDLEKLVTH
jgi:3-phosphoshikimate 1-carboxyvinyltransferase